MENVEINMKIDLKRFLPLFNIKFWAAFAGKIDLKLKISLVL